MVTRINASSNTGTKGKWENPEFKINWYSKDMIPNDELKRTHKQSDHTVEKRWW